MCMLYRMAGIIIFVFVMTVNGFAEGLSTNRCSISKCPDFQAPSESYFEALNSVEDDIQDCLSMIAGFERLIKHKNSNTKTNLISYANYNLYLKKRVELLDDLKKRADELHGFITNWSDIAAPKRE